jgi:hypothetical protein
VKIEKAKGLKAWLAALAWLVWATVLTGAALGLGFIELEVANVIGFLMLVALIGFSFELFQRRIALWLDKRRASRGDG